MDKEIVKRLDLERSLNGQEDWMNAISACRGFIVLGEKALFEDAQEWAKTLYAKSLNKPFLVVIKKGERHIIPEDYLEGVETYIIVEYESEEELRSLIFDGALIPEIAKLEVLVLEKLVNKVLDKLTKGPLLPSRD